MKLSQNLFSFFSISVKHKNSKILAKPSLSQISSHHSMVTKLPNHICDISWHIVLEANFFSEIHWKWENNMASFLNKMHPRFSMAL